MATPAGYLVTPVAFRADGTLHALELTDSDELKVALATATGSDLLTELQQKLETADLNLDASGDLQVDVLSSALPTDAATETKQDTMITALQLIDDLRGALGSVWTDTFTVRTDVSGVALSIATAANQTTMITALQLIDDLRNALGSVATDHLHTEVIAALPAGDNNIGNVDVVTLPTATVVPGAGEKLFGFSGIVEEALNNTNLSAGTNTLTGTTVPAGEVWVITHVATMYVGTSPTRTYIQVAGLATGIIIHQIETPTSGVWYDKTTQLILQAGDHMDASVGGATAGDDFHLRYAGYKLAAP